MRKKPTPPNSQSHRAGCHYFLHRSQLQIVTSFDLHGVSLQGWVTKENGTQGLLRGCWRCARWTGLAGMLEGLGQQKHIASNQCDIRHTYHLNDTLFITEVTVVQVRAFAQ